MREPSDIGWLTARPIAHRGYHDIAAGRIENTLSAFEAAVAHNFAIECDVRETGDQQVVVFHDDALDRLTQATGLVADTNLAEVRRAPFRSGNGSIPLFDELLDLTDGRVPLVVELKTADSNGHRLAAAVTAALGTYAGPVALMSFEPETMAAVRSLAPHLPRGMLVDAFDRRHYPALSAASRFALRHLFAAPLVRPQFVACHVGHLPASAPLALRHFFDLPLLAWTVRTPRDLAAARAWADQIIFEGFDPDL